MIAVAQEPAVVAGLPAILRTAHRLAADDRFGPVLLCGASEAFASAWHPELDRLRVRTVSLEELRRDAGSESGTLVLCSSGIPAGDELRGFGEQAGRLGVRAAWVWRGRPVCVFEPDARRAAATWEMALAGSLDRVMEDSAVVRVEAADQSWMPLESAEDATRAEQRTFAGLPHGRDGYLSQFDRRVSIAITRRLARTRVTPNQITAVSIAVGLAGAALIAQADYTAMLVGVFLAWLSSILDGCDGELARLKLLASEAGRRFDLFGDFLVNFSVLASIAWHVHRTRPDVDLSTLGLVLVSGVALSAFTAGWVFLRKPGHQPDGLERAFQRLASRDFIYVVIPLAALDRLDWFVYGAAVGAQLFWIALLALVASRRLATRTAAK